MNEIEKQLKDCNSDRNKIAHYGLEHDIETTKVDGVSEFTYKPPTLQPSRSNRVSRLLGRTADCIFRTGSAPRNDGEWLRLTWLRLG
jgi:hypothetical protein